MLFGHGDRKRRHQTSLGHAEATHRALVAIGKVVQKQAYILAFSDTFYLLGAALIVALMLRKNST